MSGLHKISRHRVTGVYSGGRCARYIGVRSQCSDTSVRRQLAHSLAPEISRNHRNGRYTEEYDYRSVVSFSKVKQNVLNLPSKHNKCV
jgi:hypothetical protein